MPFILKSGIGLSGIAGVISAVTIPLTSGNSSNKSEVTTSLVAFNGGGREA